MHPDSHPQALENIEAIVKLEQEFLERRTLFDRAADAIASFIGTTGFVVLQAVLFASWIAVNSGLVPGVKPFDPFPFMFLGMALSLEGVLLTTFVLMKQNRMSKRADQRNQLNLQVDLLSEREITKMLQMLRQIAERMGLEEVAGEAEIHQLSQHTSVDQLAEELRKQMPD